MKNNLFVCGLIGSGKDSIVKYLQDNDYYKLRLSGTIKQFIQDIYGYSNDELENKKREHKEIRELHHEISSLMDKFNLNENLISDLNKSDGIPSIKSDNRLNLILNNNSIDFENKIDKYIISDVRSFREIEIIFKSNKNLIGIFLLRTTLTTEYINDSHWTNQLNYNDDNLIDLMNKYKDQCIVIDNIGNEIKYLNYWDNFYLKFKGKINKINLPRQQIDKTILLTSLNHSLHNNAKK